MASSKKKTKKGGEKTLSIQPTQDDMTIAIGRWELVQFFFFFILSIPNFQSLISN